MPQKTRKGFIESSLAGMIMQCRGLSGINQLVTYHTSQSPHLSSVQVLSTNNDYGQVNFSLPSLPSFISQLVILSLFTCTHLYTWVKNGTVRVKYLAQEHNTVPWLSLEPGPLDPESIVRTIRPLRLLNKSKMAISYLLQEQLKSWK